MAPEPILSIIKEGFFLPLVLSGIDTLILSVIGEINSLVS